VGTYPTIPLLPLVTVGTKYLEISRITVFDNPDKKRFSGSPNLLPVQMAIVVNVINLQKQRLPFTTTGATRAVMGDNGFSQIGVPLSFSLCVDCSVLVSQFQSPFTDLFFVPLVSVSLGLNKLFATLPITLGRIGFAGFRVFVRHAFIMLQTVVCVFRPSIRPEIVGVLKIMGFVRT